MSEMCSQSQPHAEVEVVPVGRWGHSPALGPPMGGLGTRRPSRRRAGTRMTDGPASHPERKLRPSSSPLDGRQRGVSCGVWRCRQLRNVPVTINRRTDGATAAPDTAGASSSDRTVESFFYNGPFWDRSAFQGTSSETTIRNTGPRVPGRCSVERNPPPEPPFMTERARLRKAPEGDGTTFHSRLPGAW